MPYVVYTYLTHPLYLTLLLLYVITDDQPFPRLPLVGVLCPMYYNICNMYHVSCITTIDTIILTNYTNDAYTYDTYIPLSCCPPTGTLDCTTYT
jgi:hypothetical protein